MAKVLGQNVLEMQRSALDEKPIRFAHIHVTYFGKSNGIFDFKGFPRCCPRDKVVVALRNQSKGLCIVGEVEFALRFRLRWLRVPFTYLLERTEGVTSSPYHRQQKGLLLSLNWAWCKMPKEYVESAA